MHVVFTCWAFLHRVSINQSADGSGTHSHKKHVVEPTYDWWKLISYHTIYVCIYIYTLYNMYLYVYIYIYTYVCVMTY